MNIFIILLRLIHIFAGVFWAGVTFFVVTALGPTARSFGQEGGKFMQRLAGPGRMTLMMGVAATLSALSGILLYIPISGTFQIGYITSGRGLVLTTGALAGLVAWILGLFFIGRTNLRLAALAQQIAEAGGPPSPQQKAELGRLQERGSQAGLWVAILLVIALVGMSITEYILF